MKLIAILAALLLTVGAAVALVDSDDGSTGGGVAFELGDVRLVSVESCDELLDWYRTTASETDAGFLGGYFAVGGDVALATGAAEGGAVARDSAAPVTSVAAPSADEAGQGDGAGFSGTNVQERDVDEPDTVKTDGDVLVQVAYDSLRIVDVGDGEPRLIATLPLEQGAGEILLSGDRVLVLSTVWREDPSSPPAPAPGAERLMMIAPAGTQATVLTAVDISDPANPQVVEQRELPGTYRSARATGTTARIVLVHTPQLPQPGPAVYESSDQRMLEARLEEWKTEAIASMTLEDWAPAVTGDCSSVARTAAPEGMSTTTVVTLDLQGSLDQLDSDSVVADAATVYASTDRLVIATSRWSQAMQPEGGEVSTELHAFDIADPAQTTYVGSGAVEGYLLNQFAVSEHDGNLRVATTEEAPWDPATETQQTQSGITVLDPSMQQIGRLEGLGVTERIQAVRYLGDVAFVVTFRQTDPLYAIDLRDPRTPRVAGELKVPGYSAYLHPIDGTRLLGVGQDATDEGRVLGTQVATFDISALDAMTRVDVKRIDGASSAVEWDHRAFLWWPATRTAVIPLEIYSEVVGADCPPDADCIQPVSAQPYSGAVAFGVGDDGAITEVGRVSHQAHANPNGAWWAIQRSVVVGDALYTLSDAGVLKSDLGTLADEGFAPFPAPAGADQPIGIPIEDGPA